MVTTLPYGSWPSPISAELLATGGTSLGAPQLIGDEVWWTEGIATEEGRIAIVRTDGPVHDPQDAPAQATVLPAPFSARSRVHEYGGTSWTALPSAPERAAHPVAEPGLASPVTGPGPASRAAGPPPAPGDRPLVLFVNFADQRIHAFREGEAPHPLSPLGPEVETAQGPSLRWACPTPVTLPGGAQEVWWICEDHTGGAQGPRTGADGAPHIERYVAAVPLDGSAAEDPAAIRRVTPASRFVAHPRLSPDGSRLAWLSWEHPQMPWDGTQLHIAPLIGGSADDGTVVAGATDISVLHPEWLDDQRLLFISDQSGWWNPWLWTAADGARQVLTAEEEFAGPLWQLGETSFQVLDDDHALVQHGRAATSLSVLTVSTGRLAPVECPLTRISAATVRADGMVALAGASPTRFSAIHLAQLRGVDGAGRGAEETAGAEPGVAVTSGPALSDPVVLRSSREDAPDPAALPVAESIEVPLDDGGVVHAIIYRPRQEGFDGREGELPPFIARVHGGPTAHVEPVLSLPVAYYTSRGLGVVEVNYGGSTGYGRAYRDRLQGQWGVVDVHDTVAVMEHLVAEGIADGNRLAIEGGSAGGWTVLACLTRTRAFAAGASSYGVADLERLRADTHDFESRYIDGLVGPYPERRDLYVERSPLSHIDELEVPVLLLQGDEDRIVPPSQSEMVRDALADKGIPHAYLLFEGEQHGFRTADSIIRATESALSFYGQVLGFSPLCVPVLELQRG